jgi:hypothetical protein
MLKYLQIYCFDTCKAQPINHIFDEDSTFKPIYFSNKDKCLDFHKLALFKFDIIRMPNIILCYIITNFKTKMFYTFYKSIQIYNYLFHAPYYKPFVLFLFNLEPSALPTSKFVNMCSRYKQCRYT